ncbi:MAG: MFS transporter [Rhodospirillales bacterium]|nr:MFS transporter [Rhodospirillales bacterium]
MPELTRTLALRVFVPFAFGYFLSYLGRVVNAVLAPHLIAAFGLGAADLGFLTSVYFLAFAAFQLPLGILLDRFGPRRIEAGLILVAALGAFLFGAADGLAGLTAGRALMGLGVSACLMAPFTAYRLWFPAARVALANGLLMACGGLGAIAGTVPVEIALGLAGWRGVLVLYGLAVVAAAALMFLVVPEGGRAETPPSLAQQLRELVGILGDPLFVRVAGATLVIQGTFIGLQSLWVGPWLADAVGLKGAAVADYLFWIALGMAVGYAGMGVAADRLARLRVPTATVALAATIGLLATQAAIIVLPPALAAPLWILFTFLGSSNVLWYSALYQSFPVEMAGRAATALNVFVFLGIFACQWGVGVVVDFWPRDAAGAYPAEAYRAAFAALLAVELLGIGWYLFKRRAKFRG